MIKVLCFDLNFLVIFSLHLSITTKLYYIKYCPFKEYSKIYSNAILRTQDSNSNNQSISHNKSLHFVS